MGAAGSASASPKLASLIVTLRCTRRSVSPATYGAIVAISAAPFLDGCGQLALTQGSGCTLSVKARGQLPSCTTAIAEAARVRSWRRSPRPRCEAGAPGPQRPGRPSIPRISVNHAVYSAPDFCTKKRNRFNALILVFPVGTPVSERPPDRSERAQFGHSAPTSGV